MFGKTVMHLEVFGRRPSTKQKGFCLATCSLLHYKTFAFFLPYHNIKKTMNIYLAGVVKECKSI